MMLPKLFEYFCMVRLLVFYFSTFASPNYCGEEHSYTYTSLCNSLVISSYQNPESEIIEALCIF